MSPIALIGALEGNGRMTLNNGRVARLNPAAFETLIRAVDRGLPIDATRVGDRMSSALAGGALAIRRAESGISIEGGQARMLSNPVLATADVDLAVNALVNLADGAHRYAADLVGHARFPGEDLAGDRGRPQGTDRCRQTHDRRLRVHELAGLARGRAAVEEARCAGGSRARGGHPHSRCAGIEPSDSTRAAPTLPASSSCADASHRRRGADGAAAIRKPMPSADRARHALS